MEPAAATPASSIGPAVAPQAVEAEPSPPSSGVKGAFRSAGRALRGYFTDKQRLTRIAISAGVALPFVFLVVYFTKGGLLYRIDWVGVYSPLGFFRTPIPDAILPSIASGLSLGNLTAANYITLFLDAFVCSYGAQLLVRELFKNTFSDRWFIGLQTIAAVAYILNPYNVTWSVYSLQLELFLSQAAFFVVMVCIIRLVRAARAGKPFSGWDAALLGIMIGLSMPASLPNDARVLAFEAGGLLLAGIGLLWIARERQCRPAVWGVIRTFLLITVPIAALLLINPIYSAYVSGLFVPSNVVKITQVVSAVTKEYTPFFLAIRLLGRPELFAAPYLKFYTKIPITIAASYMWPVLALVVPIPAALLLKLRDRAWIIIAVLLAFACAIWGAGGKPPFGVLYIWVNSHIPYGSSLVPPFYPIQLLGTKLYSALVPFSVAMVYYGVCRAFAGRRRKAAAAPTPKVEKRRKAWRRFRRSGIPGYLVAGTVVGFVFLAAIPFYTGGIFYGGIGSGKGFFVPDPYFEVRTFLQHEHANAVLLPPLPTYVNTRWGLHSATSFYSAFYYPSKIVVPGYYGAYQTDFGGASQVYNLATHPLEPGPNGNLQPAQSRAWEVNTTYSTNTTFVYRPSPSFSIGGSVSWLTIALPTPYPIELATLFQTSSATVNITTAAAGLVGHFDFLPGRYNSLVTAVGVSQVDISLLVWNPSVSYPYGGYQSGGAVTYFNVTVDQPNATGLLSGPPSFTTIRGSEAAPEWITLMQSYDVQYILADYSVQNGLEERPVVNDTLIDLQNIDMITPVFMTANLELWQING